MSTRELSPEWQRWIAENIASGRAVDEIVIHLVEHGVAPAIAWPAVARPLADALARRDSLLGVLSSLSSLTLPEAIPRRAAITRDEFLHQHYAVQRPLVLTGLLPIPWTFASLASRFGSLEVEIQDNRESEPGRYQRDFDRFCRRVRLSELLARIESRPSSNDFYLAARNRLLEQPGAAALLGDLPSLPDLFEPATTENVAVWIGPAGTLTPLHHDWINAAIVQVAGRKRFHLVPATDAPHLANRESRFSDLDCETGLPPTVTRVYDVTLAPGELLFVPVGWWHQARALDPSITVSLTGFAFPNRYTWSCDTSG